MDWGSGQSQCPLCFGCDRAVVVSSAVGFSPGDQDGQEVKWAGCMTGGPPSGLGEFWPLWTPWEDISPPVACPHAAGPLPVRVYVHPGVLYLNLKFQAIWKS